MGLEFIVDRRVLIPRPETEIVVEQVVRYAKEHFSGQPMRILDIGTGSGCIAVSLAALLENASIVAFDKSSGRCRCCANQRPKKQSRKTE